MIIDSRKVFLFLLPLVALFFAPDVFALGSQAGPGLPGESSLTMFRQFILGPVGLTLSILAIMMMGYALWRGGEMGTLMSTGVFGLIGIGFVLGASQVVMILFPGAVITEEDATLILSLVGAI